MELFAHSTSHDSTNSFSDFIQQPVVAVILATVVVALLMYFGIYLVKRYTDAKFPYNP